MLEKPGTLKDPHVQDQRRVSFFLLLLLLLSIVLPVLTRARSQENMWRWYLGLSAAPAALVCVAYRLIPESARYLSVVGRNDEALQVLEEVARVNGKLHVLGLDSAEHVGEDIEARLTSAPASDISTGGGTLPEAFRLRH